MNCYRCGFDRLDLVSTHARCARCFALMTQSEGAWVPLQVQAPGGGENDAFNAIFEQQLGFAPRAPAPTMAAPPQTPLGRYISLGIGCFVFGILGAVGLYVVLVLRSAMP